MCNACNQVLLLCHFLKVFFGVLPFSNNNEVMQQRLCDIAGFFFVHRSQNSVPQFFSKLSFLAITQFPKIQKLSFYDILKFEF